jgi:hypothetical protein
VGWIWGSLPGYIEYTSKLAKTDEPIQRLFNCMEKTVEES